MNVLLMLVVLVLVAVAAIGSFAAYRSRKIFGSETVNTMRLVRSVAYLVALLMGIATLAAGQHWDMPLMLVIGMLALGDAVSYVDRIGELMRYERPHETPTKVHGLHR